MIDSKCDATYLKNLRKDIVMHLLKYRFTPSEIKEATGLDAENYLTERERIYFYTQH